MSRGYYQRPWAGETVRETECRLCGDSIAFIRLTSGKYNPVDPESRTVIALDKSGDPWVTEFGDVVRGRPDPKGSVVAYRSHFATCRCREQRRK